MRYSKNCKGYCSIPPKKEVLCDDCIAFFKEKWERIENGEATICDDIYYVLFNTNWQKNKIDIIKEEVIKRRPQDNSEELEKKIYPSLLRLVRQRYIRRTDKGVYIVGTPRWGYKI